MKRLRNSFKKFYGRHPDLIRKCQRSVKDMIDASFVLRVVSCSGTIGFQPFLCVLIFSLGMSIFII